MVSAEACVSCSAEDLTPSEGNLNHMLPKPETGSEPQTHVAGSRRNLFLTLSSTIHQLHRYRYLVPPEPQTKGHAVGIDGILSADAQ
jgi:hypothetical protein